MGSHPNATFHPLIPDQFEKESKEVIKFIADFYRHVEQYPVRSQVEPGYLTKLLPDSAPQTPQPIDTILADVENHIFPGVTHWQSPTFFAYFPASASTAGFLGEMLCTGLNAVGFSWIASPAATELETVVMDWMARMLGLPGAFMFSGEEGGGGVLHGNTSEAVVCTLAAARDNAIGKAGARAISELAVYASDQTHFTFQKAAKLVGIPPSNFRIIPTSAASGYALTADSVRRAFERDAADGLVPLYLCATVGSTAVGAVDPLLQLGEVARRYGVWMHVDAAYAGSAGVCPELRHYFNGVELAESFSMNPQKWLLTNLDCCCLWVKNPSLLTETLGTDPEILKNKETDARSVIDYRDWQIAMGRRFRAIKLWVVIRRCGVANLVEHIRSDIAMAKHFERLVAMDGRFEVVVPRKFSLVCFRLVKKVVRDGAIDDHCISELNRRLLEAVNVSGRVFMTHAVVEGAFVLRFAVGATLTETKHVEATWKLIQAKAKEILDQVGQDRHSLSSCSLNGVP